MTFEIETDEAPPAGRGSVPEYADAVKALAKLKIGQSVLFPVSAIPVAHSRVVAQRYARDNEDVKLVTRSVKDGEDVTGIRIHRVGADAESAQKAKPAAAKGGKR